MTTIIKLLPHNLRLVTDSQGTERIREEVGEPAAGYDSFFVREEQGEQGELAAVWGFCGIVPYLSKLVTKLK
jgi:hypothetical protein